MSTEKQEETKVADSVNAIYQRLLARKAEIKVQKNAEKEARKAEKKAQEEEEQKKNKKDKDEDIDPKEKKYREWKALLSEISGEDLEYRDKKKKKNSYSHKKWLDVDTEPIDKPKKKKKKNYHKEFDPELKMLKTSVAEQNKFTAEMQKRLQNALGPALKDANPPNKTMVELAAVVNAGRSNSLGMIREIAAIKKNIAELSMKQKKLDIDSGKLGTMDTNDLTLMGSSVMNSMFDSSIPLTYQNTSIEDASVVTTQQQSAPDLSGVQIQKFDPSTWDGPQLQNDFTRYESIPHEVFVEVNDTTGERRYVAIDSHSGNELSGCNLPTDDPNKLKYNDKTDRIVGIFGESYRVKHTG